MKSLFLGVKGVKALSLTVRTGVGGGGGEVAPVEVLEPRGSYHSVCVTVPPGVVRATVRDSEELMLYLDGIINMNKFYIPKIYSQVSSGGRVVLTNIFKRTLTLIKLYKTDHNNHNIGNSI